MNLCIHTRHTLGVCKPSQSCSFILRLNTNRPCTAVSIVKHVEMACLQSALGLVRLFRNRIGWLIFINTLAFLMKTALSVALFLLKFLFTFFGRLSDVLHYIRLKGKYDFY